MKFKIMFFLFFLVSFADAQVGNQLQQVILPSPNTREFDKYIKYNVSMQNGLPDINIPLYEIVTKGITIPINLNYHASGIKHRQNSGEVGLGWVINPRYRVSKTVYGREDGNMPVILDPSSAFGAAKDRDAYLTNFFDGSSYAGLPPASFSYDGEYDIYNYAMGGTSGTFIEKNTTTHEFELLDSRNVKITKQYSGNQYYFDLKDEKGIAYRMGSPNGPMETYGGGFSPVSGLAWMVTQINTPNNDVVNFEYITKNVNEQTPNLISSVVQDGIGQQLSGACLPTTESVNYPQYSNYTTSLIKKIITDFETIEFFHQSIGELLQKIEIRDKNNVLKRKIEFTYRQYNDYTFLDVVSIFPSDGTAPQVYSLQYYAENGALNLQTFDNWGYIYYVNTFPYYNEYLLPNAIADIQVKGLTEYNCTNPTPIQVSVAGYLGSYSFNDKNITVDPTDYSLKRITYPTGGYTEYEYESNQYLMGSSGAKKGAGLRVKSISSNDGINGKTLIKSYTYGSAENGYGHTRLDIGAEDFVREGIWSVKSLYDPFDPNGFNEGSNAIETKFEFSNKASNEVLVDNAATIYYPEVNEYMKDVNGNIYGKTQFLFEVPDVWFGAYDRFQTNSSYLCYPYLAAGAIPSSKNRRYFPRYIKRNIPWAKPYLTESNTFGYSNNIYNLLKKEQLLYDEIVRETFTGLKVRPFLTGGSRPYTNDGFGKGAYDDLVHSVFDYVKYYVESGTILPREKNTTEYSVLGNTVVTQQYYYNENDQLVKEETTDSKSGLAIRAYKYPADYKNLTGGDVLTQGIKNLQIKNMLGSPIESTIWKKISGSLFLAAAEFRSYNSSSVWPDLLLRIDNSSLLSDFSPSSVLSGAVVRDSRYKNRALIKYDADGNILEQQLADGPKINYIWSYRGQYPVAEIRNSDYLTIENTLGTSNIATFRSTSPDKSGVDGFLSSLKTALPSAHISSFVYLPLIGMISQTDPKGMTTYYEYDTFQRLKYVKDQNGNIVKAIDYRYKP